VFENAKLSPEIFWEKRNPAVLQREDMNKEYDNYFHTENIWSPNYPRNHPENLRTPFKKFLSLCH